MAEDEEMRARVQWLSEVEKELVIEEALGLLERVGLRIEGSQSLDRLSDAGAIVDRATEVVRFPAAVVRAAVEGSPRDILLGAATVEQDVLLCDGTASHFCPSGCAALTLDYRTGEHRPSSMEDLRQATALLDETPELEVMWTTVTPSDVPIERRELVAYGAVLQETTKHVTFVDSPSQVEPLRRLAEILSGDLRKFRERPRFSTLFTVASPFRMSGRLLDFHAQAAAFGAPVEVFTVPMAGGTAPITVAGVLAQTMAELLGAVAALQALTPGARVIIGPSPTLLDMQTAQISYGSPEAALMGVACVELAHHLGLPVICPGLATEAKHAGLQAGYEKALKGYQVAAAGADLISGGMGLIDTANHLYLPQIAIDAEIVAQIKRLLTEVEISREAVLSDMIERVGIGGNFLAERETRRRARESFRPVIGTHLSYESWRQAGRDEVDAAVERVEAVLARRAQRPSYLSDEQLAAIEEVCGSAL
jgi:trimethylamine--corrinoid protein Co-methyltransferase